MVDYNLNEFDEIDDVPLTERLKQKIRLYRCIEKEFMATSMNRKTYPKGYEKCKTRELVRDLKKGIKKINKNIPMSVEMPKLTSVGNGQVKRVYPMQDHISGDENIEVTLPTTNFIEEKH